jgi:hypothetical protein
MIVCTRYANDANSRLERQEGILSGREKIMKDLKYEFDERFQHRLNDDQFVFIDNTVFIS